MSTISSIKLLNNTKYNITLPLLSSGFTTTAGSSTSGSYLAAKWAVSGVNGITTPVDGMTIAVRVPLAGNSGGILLSIDGGTTYYPIVRNVNSLVTTNYGVGSTIVLTFNSTQTASPYVTSGTATEVTGCWQIADYDSNTKTSSGTSNNTGTKMYIVAGTSQSSSGVTTYSNSKVYIGTDNCLYSNGSKVALASEIPSAITVDSAMSSSSTNPVQNKVINTALNGKVSTSTKADVTLSASSWSSGNYTVSNSNITATNVVELIPSSSITADQFEALCNAKIVGGTQAAGSIVLRALGDVPTINIPVTFVFRRDT